MDKSVAISTSVSSDGLISSFIRYKELLRNFHKGVYIIIKFAAGVGYTGICRAFWRAFKANKSNLPEGDLVYNEKFYKNFSYYIILN